MSSQPSCVDDVEKLAKNVLDPRLYRFYEGGADEEDTLRRNITAFQRYAIRPEVLTRSVQDIDLSVSLMGGKFKINLPIAVSPSGFHMDAHPLGEMCTAKACANLGTIITLSAWTNTSMEKIISESGVTLWHNNSLYVYEPKVIQLAHRAEKAGAWAIVITCDSRGYPTKRRFPGGSSKFNDHLLFDRELPNFTAEEARKCWGGNANATWKYFEKIVKLTNLPVIAKGIMTGVEARNAIKHGVSAIWVSNHGGRQNGGLPGTLDMLPEVIKEVNGECDVYIDGGFRNGNDIFKALALGAKAVFIARPVLWGMAYDGQAGVENIFEILKTELVSTMKMTGCQNVAQINHSKIIKICECCSKL